MNFDFENDFKGKKILLLCEGNAEVDIMERLLDYNLLVFEKEQLVFEKAHQVRSAQEVQSKFLGLDYGENPPIIVRICDSKNEKFKLNKKLYSNTVINIFTRPEIEILYIIKADEYEKYTNKQKSKEKPSTYCNRVLKMKNVKKKGFANEIFQEIEELRESLEKYKKYHKDECCIFDLLRENVDKLS